MQPVAYSGQAVSSKVAELGRRDVAFCFHPDSRRHVTYAKQTDSSLIGCFHASSYIFKTNSQTPKFSCSGSELPRLQEIEIIIFQFDKIDMVKFKILWSYII